MSSVMLLIFLLILRLPVFLLFFRLPGFFVVFEVTGLRTVKKNIMHLRISWKRSCK